MPITPKNYTEMVATINQSFAIARKKDIKPQSGTGDAKGSLLYPCSGVDITYPLLMCPQVEEFILVDNNDLFGKDLSQFNTQLSQTIKNTEELSRSGNTTTKIIEPAMGGWEGYDSSYWTQRTFNMSINELGFPLLYRLRQCCGMDIQQIENIQTGVYKIEGLVNSQKKTIYYVQHELGGEQQNTPAYSWLQEHVRKTPITTVFLKGFAPSINAEQAISEQFFDEFQGLLPANRSKMTVISDASFTSYQYPRGGVPDLIDLEKIKIYTKTPFNFGYASEIIIGDGNILTPNYPSIEMRQKQQDITLQIQALHKTIRQLKNDAHQKTAQRVYKTLYQLRTVLTQDNQQTMSLLATQLNHDICTALTHLADKKFRVLGVHLFHSSRQDNTLYQQFLKQADEILKTIETYQPHGLHRRP